MKIVNNDDEFEQFYYYKQSQPSRYPKKYPCVVEHIYMDYGGLTEHVEHRIFYIPEDVEPLSYLRGMVAYKGLLTA